jgi:hypothetical protein
MYTSTYAPLPQQSHPSFHPPDTNRGVETSIQERIDWVSFTVPIDTERVWPDGLDTVSTTTKSFNGYDTAKEYVDGRIELNSSTRPEMGIHCVLSGSTCAALAEDLADILELCWLNSGQCTRFDLALDDTMGRIHPRDATNYIGKGEVICRAKEYPISSSAQGGGYTQYFGKMASEVHVCLYEKSAEQKICGFTVRCEIRFKHKRADKAAREYLQSQDCRGLILGFVRFPTWAAWNEVFATAPIKVLSQALGSRRVIWLLGQVSKSIALEISERGGDMEILDKIRDSVMMKLSDIRQAGDELTI